MPHGLQIINTSIQNIEQLMLAEQFRAFCLKNIFFKLDMSKTIE
jgi:hypothetical protein